MKYVQCNYKTFKANASPNTQANTSIIQHKVKFLKINRM